MSARDSSKSNTSMFSRMRRRDRLRNHDQVALQVPAQRDLRRRLAMLARQFLDHLFLYRLALGQRAPGFGGDAVALMEGAQLALRESGMQLDLVHRRRHAGILDQPAQVGLGEVRHADRARAAVLLHLDHRAPGFQKLVAAGHRPVDQVQVDIGQAQLAQALVHRRVGVVVAVLVVPQLGGDEQVLRATPAARSPRPRLPRSGKSRPCPRTCSRRPALRPTLAAACSSGTCHTPRPNCGILFPSFNLTAGTFDINPP